MSELLPELLPVPNELPEVASSSSRANLAVISALRRAAAAASADIFCLKIEN